VTAVLFTCAGQRVDIVSAFREAGATTIATDVDQLAPALYHADRRAIVPRVDDFGYVAALRDLVKLHDVRLIVPLTDLDHLVLAEARADLGGSVVLVPEPESFARCSD
jgi:carbamoyl-phosphate synthase large subunit